jgi:hypothetical protein
VRIDCRNYVIVLLLLLLLRVRVLVVFMMVSRFWSMMCSNITVHDYYGSTTDSIFS